VCCASHLSRIGPVVGLDRAKNARKILNKTRSFSIVERRGRAEGRFSALASIFHGSFHRLSFSVPPRTSPDNAGSADASPSPWSDPASDNARGERTWQPACASRGLQDRHTGCVPRGGSARVLAFSLVQDVDAARIDLDGRPHGLKSCDAGTAPIRQFPTTDKTRPRTQLLATPEPKGDLSCPSGWPKTLGTCTRTPAAGTPAPLLRP
jgi:hypothetical protein